VLKYADGDFIAGIWKDGLPYKSITARYKNKYYVCEFNMIDMHLHCKNAGYKFGKSREAAVARWMGQYIHYVANATVNQWKEHARIEAEAPSFCKERRHYCEAHCFGDSDCIGDCYFGFLKCVENSKQ